ncbi:MAG: repair protein RadA protein [Microgenomates group bacterium GW2011_GWC2_45_8]|nr:MAG: repair protein RadA protein [Microgenomates group bacterium GW2011_GWC2_45_8]
MVKSSVVFECQNCGSQSAKWAGQCSECGKWNSLTESVILSKHSRSVGALHSGSVGSAKLQKLEEIETKTVGRVKTGIEELDRVLGGGIVPGEVCLMIGEPGIGKSTLLTQLAMNLDKVVYVCGEESPGQVKLRIDRLRGKSVAKDGPLLNRKGPSFADLQMLAETDVDVIIVSVNKLDLSLLIILFV